MIHRVDMVFAGAQQDPVSETEASAEANPSGGSWDPAAVVAVEEQARPSSHILYLVAVAG